MRTGLHAQMSKGFHEKLLRFAMDLGMGGLGYLEVAEDLASFCPSSVRICPA